VLQHKRTFRPVNRAQSFLDIAKAQSRRRRGVFTIGVPNADTVVLYRQAQEALRQAAADDQFIGAKLGS
jgi:hypothetical protein